MIIDSHTHAGHGNLLQHSWDTFEDVTLSLKRMDQAGIDQAVIFPINTNDYKTANRELAEIVARYPTRLHGYAKVNQEKDAGRVASLVEEAFGPLKLRGLKLHGLPNREIMEAMKDQRKPMIVDPFGDVYPLRFVAEQYPQVPIIIAHMGKFLAADDRVVLQTLWLAKTYPNVYFDTSSVNVFAWLERAVKEELCRKMIFGSDGPVLHCAVELERIRLLKLPPGDEARVLYKNIAELLDLRV